MQANSPPLHPWVGTRHKQEEGCPPRRNMLLRQGSEELSIVPLDALFGTLVFAGCDESLHHLSLQCCALALSSKAQPLPLIAWLLTGCFGPFGASGRGEEDWELGPSLRGGGVPLRAGRGRQAPRSSYAQSAASYDRGHGLSTTRGIETRPRVHGLVLQFFRVSSAVLWEGEPQLCKKYRWGCC